MGQQHVLAQHIDIVEMTDRPLAGAGLAEGGFLAGRGDVEGDGRPVPVGQCADTPEQRIRSEEHQAVDRCPKADSSLRALGAAR